MHEISQNHLFVPDFIDTPLKRLAVSLRNVIKAIFPLTFCSLGIQWARLTGAQIASSSHFKKIPAI